MILTGEAIRAAIANGDIQMTPFAPATLNPNSIDIHLGDSVVDLGETIVDAAQPLPDVQTPVPPEGMMLRPGRLYLAPSRERFGSKVYAPMVHGKSNIARGGLFIHANGELIDRGVIGVFQFQLAPTLPIRVFAGMAIAQVSFWSVRD
jgi:dCTP deaminase